MTVIAVRKTPEFVKQTTCRHCSTLLEYTESDVQKGVQYSYIDSDYVKFITCPECESKVYL